MHIHSAHSVCLAEVRLALCCGLEYGGCLWGLLQQARQVPLSLVCKQVLHCMAHVEEHQQERALQCKDLYQFQLIETAISSIE